MLTITHTHTELPGQRVANKELSLWGLKLSIVLNELSFSTPQPNDYYSSCTLFLFHSLHSFSVPVSLSHSLPHSFWLTVFLSSNSPSIIIGATDYVMVLDTRAGGSTAPSSTNYQSACLMHC